MMLFLPLFALVVADVLLTGLPAADFWPERALGAAILCGAITAWFAVASRRKLGALGFILPIAIVQLLTGAMVLPLGIGLLPFIVFLTIMLVGEMRGNIAVADLMVRWERWKPADAGISWTDGGPVTMEILDHADYARYARPIVHGDPE